MRNNICAGLYNYIPQNQAEHLADAPSIRDDESVTADQAAWQRALIGGGPIAWD